MAVPKPLSFLSFRTRPDSECEHATHQYKAKLRDLTSELTQKEVALSSRGGQGTQGQLNWGRLQAQRKSVRIIKASEGHAPPGELYMMDHEAI